MTESGPTCCMGLGRGGLHRVAKGPRRPLRHCRHRASGRRRADAPATKIRSRSTGTSPPSSREPSRPTVASEPGSPPGAHGHDGRGGRGRLSAGASALARGPCPARRDPGGGRHCGSCRRTASRLDRDRRQPGTITTGEGSVWVVNEDERTVLRIAAEEGVDGSRQITRSAGRPPRRGGRLGGTPGSRRPTCA